MIGDKVRLVADFANRLRSLVSVAWIVDGDTLPRSPLEGPYDVDLLVCHTADEDPELFFPVGNSGPALLQIAEAKTVCRRCPVVSDCLAWALESGQDAGVWGGMSEDERRALKRRNARTPARSNA